MKVSSVRTEETFNPIKLDITIETVEEARALFAIFNHSDNAALLSDDVVEDIKEEIGRGFYISSGEIANGIDADDYYRSLGKHK